MKKTIERGLIYLLKKMKVDLLTHAHIDMCLGNINASTNGEETLLRYIKSFLNPPIIFDVGANTGDYSLMLNKTITNAQIHSFEPMATTFEIANKKLQNLSNVKLNQLALGSSAGNLTLYNDKDNPNNLISSVSAEALKTFYNTENLVSYQVDVITMDKYCESNNITKISFLKIDVEGFELEVLKGSEKLLSADAIDMIQFEFNDFNISQRIFLKDFYEILPQFEFYRIGNKKLLYLGEYSIRNEVFVYQNILAINRKTVFKNFAKRDIIW